MKRLLLRTVALATIFALSAGIQAGTVMVTDRAALNANDLLDWSAVGTIFDPMGPFNPRALLPSSFSVDSQGGLTVGVSVPPPNTAARVSQPLVFQTSSSGIPTNFAAGDYLLFTGAAFGAFPAVGNPGPITLTFDNPVRAAGAQLAVDDTFFYTLYLSVLDAAANVLGSFKIDGASTGDLDNSAAFLGAMSDTANIKYLVYSSSEPERAFGLNRLSLVRDVPEPTSVFLLGLGVLWVRRRSGGRRVDLLRLSFLRC